MTLPVIAASVPSAHDRCCVVATSVPSAARSNDENGIRRRRENKHSRESQKKREKAADRWPLAIEADLALVGN